MKKKIILVILLLLFVGSGSGVGYFYYYQGTHFIKTEDARIAGDQYQAMTQMSSKITNIAVQEGDVLAQDEAIMEQELTTTDPTMISKAIVRAPIDGTVIKILTKKNQIASAGQAVALMMNMDELYVSANIEETDIKKVQVGQLVDVSIDALDGATILGKVREIGEATNSTFSLVPSINTSGNYSKVTQRIPIEIAIAKPENMELIPGTNVVVKIHIQ